MKIIVSNKKIVPYILLIVSFIFLVIGFYFKILENNKEIILTFKDGFIYNNSDKLKQKHCTKNICTVIEEIGGPTENLRVLIVISNNTNGKLKEGAIRITDINNKNVSFVLPYSKMGANYRASISIKIKKDDKLLRMKDYNVKELVGKELEEAMNEFNKG